jgi:hypothetical protein
MTGMRDKKSRRGTIIFTAVFVAALFCSSAKTSATDIENGGQAYIGISKDEASQCVPYDITSPDSGAARSLSSDVPGKELPPIYKRSLKMLEQEGYKTDDLESSIIGFLSENRDRDAAKALGEAFGHIKKSSREYVGYFCVEALHYLGRDLDAQARFLSFFLSGYGKRGVLMFTQEGIASFNASGRRRGVMWKSVRDQGSLKEDGRIFKGRYAIFIPFSAGEIFKVDLYGKPGGTVKVWKILPGGVNEKSWPGGQWEREITVRGDKLY